MRFSSLAGWLDWQAGLNPREIELGLDRVAEVWAALGRPDLAAPVITIAGTNGKGSSVAFAEAVLRAAGYRTGGYTSPHLVRYNERVRVDGRMVDDTALCVAFERIDQVRGDIPLTYFEFGTLAALLIFADARLDAVILEVGLGGRLDAVNLIDPDVALITAIGLDHQEWLGDDLEQIAAEKAGILRAGRPAVFSGAEMPASIPRIASQLGAPLLAAGRDYRVTRHPDAWDLRSEQVDRLALPLPTMRGGFQLDNAAGVLVALDCLRDRLPLDQRAVRNGLLAARSPGRFEVRPGAPTWVLDVAHNPQAAAALDDMLGDVFTAGRRVAVCGMLRDKDAASLAEILAGRFDAWYLVDLSAQPRGLTDKELAARISPLLGDVAVHQAGELEAVMAELSATLGPEDMAVVFGSFLTVGAAIAWLDRGDSGASGR
jgi:dihydrofolate synthase/folylpolyglutamate synthase